MNWYTLALFAHILGVIGLFVGLSFTLASALRLRRARTVAQVRAETTFGGAQRVLIVASSLLLLAAGIYMTVTAWDSDPPWILVSLAALLVMGVLGGGVSGRRLSAIEKAAAAEDEAGSISPALKRQLADPVLLTAMQTTGMIGLGVVFLMTAKPDLIGSLIALAAALVLGVVSALFWRRPAEARALVEKAAPGA
ncbi:MAG TPA: DUF2269 family protein [Ktedonobacterales bacterium]|nr:DUF2269 family protein [Ktedonobacterales bacterium]